MTVSAMTTDGEAPKPADNPQTLGEHLDWRIASLRRQLEAACISKAKAEAAQLLDVPVDFLREAVW